MSYIRSLLPLFLLLLSCPFLCFVHGAQVLDVPYSQVVADRYLFTSSSSICAEWSVLPVQSIKHIIAKPAYVPLNFYMWAIAVDAQQQYGLYSVSLSHNTSETTIDLLPGDFKVDETTQLFVPQTSTWQTKFTFLLVSPILLQYVHCTSRWATVCSVVNQVDMSRYGFSSINAGLFSAEEGDGWLYLGSDLGLYVYDLISGSMDSEVGDVNVSVSSLAWSSKHHTIFVGTPIRLHYHSTMCAQNPYQMCEWRHEEINGLIDAPITALTYDIEDDQLWIGQETGITLLRPLPLPNNETHWYFFRLAGQVSSPGSPIGGLPFGNVTSLAAGLEPSSGGASDGRVWIGAMNAAMRYDAHANNKADTWRVFNSARYLPSSQFVVNITEMIVLPQSPGDESNTGVALLSTGLAVIRFESWTLKQKAEHFQQFLDQPLRHSRYGLTADCDMTEFGNTKTCVKGANANDGLWTSIFLSSQVFRYALSQNASMQDDAWQHFMGMYLQNQVTGIPGYPARSFAYNNEYHSDDWHQSPVYANMQFEGDTSSDEIVGHEFIYPLVFELLANSQEQQDMAYGVLYNITHHILTHGWFLVGEKHQPTTWGRWDPYEMNNDTFYQETRGLNALQILAFLAQTYVYSGDQAMLEGLQTLIAQNRYDVNLINQKMIAACDGDFSDDELAYLSYFNYVHAVNDNLQLIKRKGKGSAQQQTFTQLLDDLSVYMNIGLELSHQYKAREKSPFFNFIYCYSTGQYPDSPYVPSAAPQQDCSQLLADAVWSLQRWPLELVDWPQFNAQRLDVQLNTAAQCGDAFPKALNVLPPDERLAHKWNGGPYDLNDGSGFNEEGPGPFLSGYWGMRYYQMLMETQQQ